MLGGIETISTFKRIKKLNMGWCGLKLVDLRPLQSLELLEDLYIGGNRLGTDALPKMASFTVIRN